MSNGQDPIPVILPRQTVENFAAERQHETDADFTRDEHALCQASKHALAHPSVTVEGDCAEVGEMLAEAAFPSIPSGPCTITIAPQGGQSDE